MTELEPDGGDCMYVEGDEYVICFSGVGGNDGEDFIAMYKEWLLGIVIAGEAHDA